jgi:hypothetical protein
VSNTWQRFQILSLDGGGIRGLFSAAVLAWLEQDLRISVVDHFDLISGTSTGGIVALGLGLGMRPREIVQFYIQHGPDIFPGRLLGRMRHLLRRKYRQEPLTAALREVFQDQQMWNSSKRLVIPSYNLGQDQVRLFKTPHHPRLRRDWCVPAWKVALATTAAPTYFPACREIDEMRLIDGGVWANNPTMIGIVEAKSMLGVPLEAMKVFSLGTCDELAGRPDRLDHGGLWPWKETAVDVILRGQSIGTHNLAVHLLGEANVKRVDPKVPSGIYSLDKITPDKLIAEASHASLHLCPLFDQEFAGHRAAAYKPIYPDSAGQTSEHDCGETKGLGLA